ncbi:MAG: hypothetical protein WDW38_009222 [Sanguina aurantia]
MRDACMISPSCRLSESEVTEVGEWVPPAVWEFHQTAHTAQQRVTCSRHTAHPSWRPRTRRCPALSRLGAVDVVALWIAVCWHPHLDSRTSQRLSPAAGFHPPNLWLSLPALRHP